MSLPTLVIPGTTIETSILGFGCASLGSRVSARRGSLALGLAYELGVRHFDVARSYGWGRAEAILGAFLRGKRAEVIVATKAGIPAPKGSRWITATKGARNNLFVRFGRSPQPKPVAHNFQPDYLRQSLETSLTELRTDYVDIFLLHALSARDPLAQDAFEALERFKQEGKIREYGVASAATDILDMRTAWGAEVPIAQVAMSVFVDEVRPLREAGLDGVITHSPFGGRATAAKLEKLSHDQTRLAHLSSITESPIRNTQDVGDLLLTYSIQASQPAPVICSMFRESHLRRNVGVASQQGSEWPNAHLAEALKTALAAV